MRHAFALLALIALKLSAPAAGPLSPVALLASPDGKTLYVACAGANRVLQFDLPRQRVSRSFSVPGSPSGLASSPDGRRLYVTSAAAESKVFIIDLAQGKTIATLDAGHTAVSPVISPDGKMLYLCNRFDDDVSVVDLGSAKEVARIPVSRQPVAADMTKDGRYLLVANALPSGRADVAYTAATVSVIDLAKRRKLKDLALPTGSGSLAGLRVSPDGRHAAVTHLVGRFSRLPTRATEGWINANALTLVDVEGMKVRSTTLLDDHYSGAANPWGVAWSADGKTLVVTHAGTHEASVIDVQDLLEKLPPLPDSYDPMKAAEELNRRPPSEMPDDLPYFPAKRARVGLPPTDLGPRSVALAGNTAYVGNYFSDTLTAVPFASAQIHASSIPLGRPQALDAVRQGDLHFHDARLCYERWQSCSSCHPGGGRADGLNWDLLNDGVGNPKNTKSLLFAPRTPPTTSLGIRPNAEASIRAGMEHILFTAQPEGVMEAIGEYLKSLTPIPSPHRTNGQLSEVVRRGEAVFSRAGCAVCHAGELYTDLERHDVGTAGTFDKPTDRFDTPTLLEVWRTAPYLHDGSAATIREVVTGRTPRDEHGRTKELSDEEIEALCAYVLSL